MAFSFDPKKESNNVANSVKAAVAPIAELATSITNDDFVLCTDGRYEIYTNYIDTDYSLVDDTKSITVNSSQINITQEENSQYIPFKLKRYWDGMDLMDMLIRFNYKNKNSSGGFDFAVNVAYNSNSIICAWLIDKDVTAIAGDVTFEIEAIGKNEKGNEYRWKTKPNGKFTVLECLKYTGAIEPNETWYTAWEAKMISFVDQAHTAAQEAKASAASINVETIKDAVIESVGATLDESINVKLDSYYTKHEIDTSITAIQEEIAGINSLSNLAVEYDNVTGKLSLKDSGNGNVVLGEATIDSLANLVVKYEVENGKGILTFFNGKTEICHAEIGNVEPSAEWTAALKADVTREISEAVSSFNQSVSDISAKTDNLETAVGQVNSGVKSLETDMSVVKTDLKTVETKVAETENAVGVMESEVNVHTAEITDLNAGLTRVEEEIANIGTAETYKYDISLNEEKTMLSLLENGEIKTQLPYGGGTGGDFNTSTIVIERITTDNTVALYGDSISIKYRFSSTDNAGDTTGNGTATWTIGSTKVASSTAIQGENTFDITPYIKTGENRVKVSITDSFGTVATKIWTITVVEFKVESTFDDKLFYSGYITFRCTPYGNISKYIHFILDGNEISGVNTSVSGRQMIQTIAPQSHGSHLLEVYMTATINNQEVVSDSIYRDIIWVDVNNTTPIIGCSVFQFAAQQYGTVTIPYVVYDPKHNPSTVSLSVDDSVLSTLTVGRTEQIWSYKSSNVGEHTLTITCGDVAKSISANIEELSIDVKPVTTNLAFDFNPSGKNNSANDWLKISDKLSIEVSDNFDTANGGYQIDEDGDTYFCVKAGTTATIPYHLFADDAKKTGKNFKFVYKTSNVKNYDASVLQCVSGGIGFTVSAQSALLASEQNSITVPYCEDNYMELEFNILPDSQHTEMVMWLDSIPSRVKVYSTSDSFTQTTPVGITIGSEDCDVLVYRMKAYTMNLTDDEILDNFIADAKNAEEMISRYMRNDILDASGNLDPDLLAEKCPDLRIIKIDTPRFTTGKKDKVKSTSFQQIYTNGRAKDNWISSNGTHSGQGTSSEYYGESGRNLDLNCSGGFDFSDGTTADKYDMTDNSIPVNYFNIKVNVASSESKNNDGCAEEFNDFNPYLRPARINDKRVRDTMEFHPCVVFIRETDVENSVEFHDGQWHFYACGNIGNSKKNSEAMGMNPDNHKEFIVEVMNNTDPQCRFLSDDLTNEGWDGDTSFEMRYENQNCTPEELQAGKDAWQTVLTWVVNATPETFVAEFEDHFIKDSVLFHYLFTERHTLVDNRAKNTFWHTEDLIHWDICFDYDNDTAMGNDNVGGLTLTYGYEDTDTIGTKSVFNASDSKIWCYVRDYLQDDLAALFVKLESQLAWSANRILTKFETEQAMKPERLWMIDMRRKYFRPYEDNGTTSYLEMMHGDKKHQRKQFQKYQEKYISSKYVGTTCTSDVITVRGYTPTNWEGVKPDGTFHIIPYADTYVVTRFGSNQLKKRAKRGESYEMKSPIAAMNDTEVYVYNASLIQSIGDISPFYPGYTDFNQGIKLTELTVGSGIAGYKNTNMNDFGIGRNTLLEHLDLRNLLNLKKTIALTDCTNLTTFLANGSGITGVIFANGGKIATAHLPAIASMTAKNLYFLNDLTLEGYNKLTTLSLDNCPTIDENEFLAKATNLTRVRLTGINWSLNDTLLLDRLAKMAGIDENGYNTVTSVLAGKVYVPVMRQQKLNYYASIWPDLKISYDTIITQYKVTFVNEDGTVLDIQYVDKGSDAVDPITREIDAIAVPIKDSTVSTDFTYSGWDDVFTSIFGDKTITAKYSETIREYTVRYVSKGLKLQETKAPYGTSVYYNGDNPTYTAEESAYKYNLFKGWDKSGLVDGDKIINAVFETCEYTEGCFDGKELSNLSLVELYAMMKLGLETNLLSVKDNMELKLGNDYSFSDIEEKEIIASDMKFDGTNHFDSGIAVMDIDRDFTIALDYEFGANNSINATLAQCFQYDGSNGFRLWWSNEPRLTWGTDSTRPSYGQNREIIVLRHKAGSSMLTVYNSALTGNEVTSATLNSIRIPNSSSTLVFGAAKADDGIFENHATGTIHWCKMWYADLGEQICKNIAQWTHEIIPIELSKFKAHYLADTNSKRAQITFLASNLLSIKKGYTSKSTNEGGWADSPLNTWLNTRLYNAIPAMWKALIKPVKVYSSTGLKSTEISVSNCHFYIPALYDVDGTMAYEPYINETNATIPYMISADERKRSKISTPEVYETYWTRSPNTGFTNYIWTVDESGNTTGYTYPSYENGVLLMFSIGV